ncbi:DUF937 domain-containing protein [Hymenobacter sp. DH14]|uniref:DUF937 domain-containing protein n=1 Tax=Hymenobacter cyanobacteriorum TaxID=2926463 RepID=A0A9X2AEZ9_9BACT|nr:DUF937 domain-containing protein [Hymenobacter cyanobacteriorum]MCI1185933.1 DUF937 domain-containing protein [Hymenobacter cyanobacteriorum]
MKNCLQAIRQAFSRELVRHLAARLGEREKAVGKALKGMVPMVLCQLLIRAGEGEGRALLAPIMKDDWPVIRESRNLTEVLALLGGGPNHSAALDAGENWLSHLFGESRPGLDALMSLYAGLRPDSAVTLLRLAAAVVTAVLAQYARRQHLTALRLSEELATAKNQIYKWLPADLPRWPGFRRRGAVKAPHAAWAAELARPYWVLVLATAAVAVVALLVLSALAGPAQRPAPTRTLLAVARLDSMRQTMPETADSTAVAGPEPTRLAPATW